LISRTNISVLIATVLLGVLLWTVMEIVREFSRIPPDQPAAPEAFGADPELPRVTNRAELESLLNDRTTRGADRIVGYTDWLVARGYPVDTELWFGADPLVPSDYAEADDKDLLVLAAAGDITAMHALAERNVAEDPLGALDWYERAIVGGSLYAMLKTADLLELLADPELQAFIASPAWMIALAKLDTDSPAPVEKALAWSVTAIIAGGFAILDEPHVNRIERLSARLDNDGIRRACDTAQQYLLETAAARRARGDTVLLTERPPIAITVPDPATRIPCDLLVTPLVNFDDCSAYAALAANDQRASVWICPYSGA
jgi:hypothetical protein